MAREVVLDANVIVAWLDDADVLAARARELMDRLKGEGAELVLIDVTVAEAVSVLCRRAKQRATSPPDLSSVIGTVRSWTERGVIRWLAREQERLMPDVLDVIEGTSGRLNFNDALLAVLQREGAVGEVASFDSGFDALEEFKRLA
jgi:predicted nucleic acid-binding protein